MAAPFEGHPLNSQWANGSPAPSGTPDTSATPSKILDAFGRQIPSTTDPAWQPPRDPLKVGDPNARARVINREIPIVVAQTGWAINDVRAALEDLAKGIFDRPAQLVDSIAGDSRVQSAMQSRVSGLLGRPLRFRLPRNLRKDPRAQKCLKAWADHWPALGNEPALSELLWWSTTLRFGVCQLVWDTSGEIWKPYLEPMHPRYVYYHWTFRRFVAVTLDGQFPIEPGDAHWVLHAPSGEYRGWLRGALRALAPWWLARNYALRDWARWSERHGMPILKAKVPFGADPTQVANFTTSLGQLGQETVVQVPTSEMPEIGSYDIDLLESKDPAWDGFRELIVQCNAEITLALLGQNLTSEVKEGSFAAARIHADVRQAILEADARSLAQTIYMQVARPFAALNFGDADLAPRIEWDVSPPEDHDAMTRAFYQFSNAVFQMRRAGKNIKNIQELSRFFGLPMSLADIEETEPIGSGEIEK